MADEPLVIRVAANLDQLRANLLEGVNQIETTSTAMRQMATAYDGSRAISQAGAVMAAIQAVGGVTHLTADEQAKANAVLDQAIQKYAALGQTAPPGMQALAEATKAVVPPTEAAANAWQTFISTFSVKGAIANPLETAVQGVTALASTLGPLGDAAVVAGTAMVSAVTAALALAKGAEEVGSRLYDASLKMSSSVPAVSQLKFAVEAAGGSLEQVSGLVFMLQQRLELEPVKFEAGLKEIHLSLQDIVALSPDQKFLAIADAIRTSGDETNKQAVAMELFGRGGRDALSLLMKPLADLVDQSKVLGFTWTEQDAKAADELAIKTRILDQEFQKLKTDIGTDLIPVLMWFANHSEDMLNTFRKGADGGLLFDVVMNKITSDMHSLSAAWDLFTGKAPELPKVAGAAKTALDGLTASAVTTNKNLLAIVDVVGEVKTATRELEEEYTKNREKDRKAAEDLKKAQAEADAIAMEGYATRIKALQDMTAASLKAYSFGAQIAALSQLDAAEQALARSVYMSLNSEKDRAKVVDEAGKRHLEILDQENALEVKHLGIVNNAVLAELAAQTELNKAQGLDASGAILIQDSALTTLNKALDRLHAQAVVGISQKQQELVLEKAYADALLAEAEADDTATQAAMKGNAELAKRPALEAAAAAATVSAMMTIAGAHKASAAEEEAWNRSAGGVRQNILNAAQVGQDNTRNGTTRSTSVLSQIRGFDKGSDGFQDFGSGTLAMLHGEEAVVRKDGSGSGGGLGGGVTNHITIHVTQPLGTPKAIADAVGEALILKLKAQGTRLPTSGSV